MQEEPRVAVVDREQLEEQARRATRSASPRPSNWMYSWAFMTDILRRCEAAQAVYLERSEMFMCLSVGLARVQAVVWKDPKPLDKALQKLHEMNSHEFTHSKAGAYIERMRVALMGERP